MRGGSSPLARGLRGVPALPEHGGGIIPARAGFTAPTAQGVPGRRDHPRSRGVYGLIRRCADELAGSSPLARGLRRDRRPGVLQMRDHPRSRGVYGRTSRIESALGGSSPLARGLRHRDHRAPGLPGIIPARAGFTWPRPWPAPPRRDHPRSRGVYLVSASSSRRVRGSSPLARGLPLHGGRLRPAGGIIPARAGFTRRRPPPPPRPRDHPRSRGVYSRWSAISGRITGIIPARAGFTTQHGPVVRVERDHPRSRGVYDTMNTKPTNDQRIIPARAGFTVPGHGRRDRSQDHPRSRGVYPWRPAAMAVWRGSSPLARGLRRLRERRRDRPSDHPRSRGVYPTGSWSTATEPGSSPLARGLRLTDDEQTALTLDHPRSRGVYGASRRERNGSFGSSPLARGLRPDAGADHGGARIIPARAGFTPGGRSRPPPWRDHPRSRGVYSPPDTPATAGSGSSPLARGLPAVPQVEGHPVGIIPARAGFTTGGRPPRAPPSDHPRSRGVYEYGCLCV